MHRLIVLLLAVAAAVVLSIPQHKRILEAGATRFGQGKVIGGIPAKNGQFPYIVSLNHVASGHVCGASILTPGWLLTTATCCSDRGFTLEAYTGSVSLSTGGKIYPVAELHVHPEFDEFNYYRNDICVISLKENITLDSNTQQVILAGNETEVPEGSPVVIAGWGHTLSDDPATPDRLQVVTDYHTLSIDNCNELTGILQYDGNLCAVSNSGQAACQGDAGGPLLYKGVQVGMSSFGWLPCGSEDPDYYTRVPKYISWIQQELGSDADLLKIAANFE